MNELKLAVSIIKEISIKIKEIQQGEIEVFSSMGKDIKLAADTVSEKLIIEKIKAKSSYKILSEENNNKFNYKNHGKIWIVDPLDGSLNFLRRIPFYSISIALWDGEQPIVGAVYDLVSDKLYYGDVEKGAYCDGIPISPSNIKRKEESVLCTGFPVYRSFDDDSLRNFINNIKNYKKIRLLGSAALSLILVARGSAEAYMEEDIAIWDVAGGLAILKAAGGEFKITKGSKENLVNVVATNGKIF